MGNVLSPYSFSLQGGYPQGTDPETYGVYEFTWSDWVLTSQNGGTIEQIAANEVKGTYPINVGGSGVYVEANLNVQSLASSEFYVEFQAKMPNVKHGMKFLKIFGEVDGSGFYANTTFGLNYTGGDDGSLYQIGFGDGVNTSNDTTHTIWLDGTHLDDTGRNFGSASVSTPQNAAFASTDWGTDWHTFRIYFKFNSGTTAINEVADGAYYVEIDGNVYVDATGLFNRHYDNLPPATIGFFNYSQSATAAFDMSIKNPRVSIEGFS